MEGQKDLDLSEELAAQTVSEALKIGLAAACNNASGDANNKKGTNAILVANEVLKTRNDAAIAEAQVQTQNRELDLKERELDLKERELDQEKKLKTAEQVNEAIKSGVQVFSIFAVGKWLKDLKVWEDAGHMVSSQSGRTILSFIKLFKR